MKNINSKLKKKISVAVGIPAYNAEKNIGRLLQSILEQNQRTCVLKKITVYSDKSSDRTVKILEKIKKRNLLVIDAKRRRGFAYALKYLLYQNKEDIVILLNDDIIINDAKFIEKTIKPFRKENNLGLVSSNPQPILRNNFIERAVVSGFIAYDKMRHILNNGSNVFTCDGKTLTLSKEFIKSIRFPKKLNEMGNVDEYLYFTCLKNGFKYSHVEDARVLFKPPSTVKDFVKWMTRNQSNKHILHKHFGELIEKEYKLPKKIYLAFTYFRLLELLKNPVGGIMIYVLGVYASFQARRSAKKNFKLTWDVVSTTKELNYLD